MRLPTRLSRRNQSKHKNQFGHVLILSGSFNMVGASALCGLSAMRSGAGLVTLGVPKSINNIVQEKISPVIMTLPLKNTPQHSISYMAFQQLKDELSKFNAIAIGPGMSTNDSTQRFVLKVIETIDLPMVIDADAINALGGNLDLLTKKPSVKVLTPHIGEMARLSLLDKKYIQENRKRVALNFAKKYQCFLVLKGRHTIVASPKGETYINKSGNSGMATAGSGDVLTGMIAAFLGQGLAPYAAVKWGVYLHGMAGDLAAKEKTRLSMIAVDIIENIPTAIKSIK